MHDVCKLCKWTNLYFYVTKLSYRCVVRLKCKVNILMHDIYCVRDGWCNPFGDKNLAFVMSVCSIFSINIATRLLQRDYCKAIAATRLLQCDCCNAIAAKRLLQRDYCNTITAKRLLQRYYASYYSIQC